jgi:DNA-directed RNA polymerase specialized sigma24 family protein
MQANDIEAEKALLSKLKSKDIRAFKRFYKEYSDDLLILAYSLLENAALAIAAVDELFERLWIDAKFEYIDPPIHRFLTAELRKNCGRTTKIKGTDFPT